jgi:hypothetical protein
MSDYYIRTLDGDYVARPEVIRIHPRQWPFTRWWNEADIFGSHEYAMLTLKRLRQAGHRGLRIMKMEVQT